jgi:glycosyltransferase involved in cell wall biosynthesis
VYASVAAAGRNIPVICTLHGTPDLGPRSIRRWLKLRVLGRSRNRVVLVSNALGSFIRTSGALPEEILRVIPNGIEDPMIHPRGDERITLGANSNEFLVGAIGNIRLAKDYPTFLRAVAGARARGCPVRAVIIGQGEGALKVELLRITEELKLSDHVGFPGFQADASRFLAAFDVYVSRGRGSRRRSRAGVAGSRRWRCTRIRRGRRARQRVENASATSDPTSATRLWSHDPAGSGALAVGKGQPDLGA